MSATPWSGGGLVEALGLTLVHFVWQGTIVAALLGAVFTGLRRADAQVRYLVGCGGLLAMLALTTVTFVTLARTSPPARPSSVTPSATVSVDAREQKPASPVQVRSRTSVGPAAETMTRPAGVTSMLRPAWPAMTRDPGLRRRLDLALPWLVALWGVGVVLLSVRLLGGWVLARRVRLAANLPLEHLRATVERLAARVGVSRPVRICRSALVEVPTVIGWLKPVILLPASALSGLTPAQLESLIAHELAHVRRHDYVVNLLQSLVETLLFYHPAVWWLSQRIREERENCCDDLAVAACGDPVLYARALCELERLRPAAGLAMAANGGTLLSRIRRLLERPRVHAALPPRWTAGFVALGMLLAVAGASAFNLGAGRAASTPLARTVSAGMVNAARMAATLVVPDAARELASRATTPLEPEVRVGWSIDTGAAQRLEKSILGELGRSFGGDPGVESAIEPQEAMLEQVLEVDPAVIALAEAGGFLCDDPSCPEGSKPDHDPAHCRAAAKRLIDAGLDQEGVAALAALGIGGLRVADLVELQMHGVTSSYVSELVKEGVTVGSTHDLVQFIENGLTADWVGAMLWLGYASPSRAALVQLQQHGVTPDFVARLRALGYRDLDADQLVKLTERGVTADLVGELRGLGYRNLSVDELVRLVEHGVTLDLVAELRGLGYAGLTVDQLTGLVSHGVSSSYVLELALAGYDRLTPEELVKLRENGVSGETIRLAERAGLKRLSVDDLIRVRSEGTETLVARKKHS